MTDLVAPPSSNGDTAPPSTHELLRLRVQERLRRDGADDLSVHRTGTRDDGAVLAAIRDVVDDYQRDADKGIGAAGRLSHPAETIARLARSLLEAGPLTKYFNNPEYADEVGRASGRDHGDRARRPPERRPGTDLRGGVDGDHHPTAGPGRRDRRLGAHDRRASDLGQPGAGVGVDPADRVEVLDCTFRIYRKQRTTFADLVEWDSLTAGGGERVQGVRHRARRGWWSPASRAPASRRTWLPTIAATPPTTNVRISQKYRELTTDQHLGGDWLAGPANKTLRDLTAGPVELRAGPGGGRGDVSGQRRST